MNATQTQTASYTKLRDGSWGIRIPGRAPTLGTQVTVVTRAGERKTETVYSVAVQFDDAALCRIAPQQSAPTRALSQRPRYRYGSGAGAAAPVAGYSSYCTGRSSCGCYDCAS
jgi:hypothetical protein